MAKTSRRVSLAPGPAASTRSRVAWASSDRQGVEGHQAALGARRWRPRHVLGRRPQVLAAPGPAPRRGPPPPAGSAAPRVASAAESLRMLTSCSPSPKERRPLAQRGGHRRERRPLEQEQLGQQLADDPRHDVAVACAGRRGRPAAARPPRSVRATNPAMPRIGAQRVGADQLDRRRREGEERVEHLGQLGQQLAVRRLLAGDLLAPSAARLRRGSSAGRGESSSAAEALQGLDAPRARPGRRVLEGVGDPEEEIGDRDLPPRGLRAAAGWHSANVRLGRRGAAPVFERRWVAARKVGRLPLAQAYHRPRHRPRRERPLQEPRGRGRRRAARGCRVAPGREAVSTGGACRR